MAAAVATLQDPLAARMEAFEQRVAGLERQVQEQRRYMDEQWGLIAARWSELGAREADLRTVEERLKAQGAALRGTNGGAGYAPQPQDITRLNVGGQTEVSVRRQTLCQVEGSMLAEQFSGRWESMAARDEKGRILIDFPPEIFMPLVNWLRLKSIEDPMNPIPSPAIPQEHVRGFKQMCEYYGIANALWPADWQVLHNATAQGGAGVQAVAFGERSFEAWAISNFQEGCFTVTADANAFLESDAFRFGLCRRGIDISERLKAVHHVHTCDWDFDDFVSPSHTGRDGDIPYIADRPLQVLIRVRLGQLVITLKADSDTFELSPMTLPTGASKSWRIFVALSHPSLHIKREEW